ncbi:MAG: histidine kinase [Nitrospinae bacterium]|nr:histidine kinase [Nitrospinota bacterium]
MPINSYPAYWANKPLEQRDKLFYLVALPVAVSAVGAIPHLIQFTITPMGYLLRIMALICSGSLITGILAYSFTRYLSQPKLWGPNRSKWPVVWHFLLISIPTAMLVDGPQRLAELAMIAPHLLTERVWPYILGVSLGRAFLLAGWVVFYERLVGAAQEAADSHDRALRLETQTLKNLIQPHFLLNSLSAVRAYIEDSPKTAEDMLLNLTSLLRRVIQYSSRELITVKEEMEVITDYVALMNQRFEAQFMLRVDGYREEAPIQIPPLIIFNLVENSFKHGFSSRRTGLVRITLEASEKLRIIVNDDGVESQNHDSTGMGGQYVQARLELLYGDSFSFTHGRKEDGHYEAVVEMPWGRG